MQKLKLPEYPLKRMEKGGRSLVFDEIRKRWVMLSPEEQVRQHFLKFLAAEKKFPLSLMAVEKKVILNGLRLRFDLLVYDRRGNPLLVGEFKAPGVEITQAAFDQALRYNSVIKAPYFLISNGMNHFACRVDFQHHQTVYLKEIPNFDDIQGQG